MILGIKYLFSVSIFCWGFNVRTLKTFEHALRPCGVRRQCPNMTKFVSQVPELGFGAQGSNCTSTAFENGLFPHGRPFCSGYPLNLKSFALSNVYLHTVFLEEIFKLSEVPTHPRFAFGKHHQVCLLYTSDAADE